LGARGELVRKEQNWRETIENARRVRAQSPHVDLATDTTVSIFNILHLPALILELVALDFATSGRFRLHLLQDPIEYNIRVLPRAMKAKARAGLIAVRRWLDLRYAGVPGGDEVVAYVGGGIDDAVSYMDAEDWTHLLPGFRAKTDVLDALRGETMTKVFPELAPLFRVHVAKKRLRRILGPKVWARLQRIQAALQPR